MTLKWIQAALFFSVVLCPIVQAADVAIDIGHTLEKPGAISAAGVTEYSFNQQLAGQLGRHLQAAGLSVRWINRDGTVTSLYQRTAQAAGDRLFVSIHHDSVKDRYRPVRDDRFQGFSFWPSETGTDPHRSLDCARRMADRLLTEGFTSSQYHADPVLGENRPVIDGPRGIFSNRNLAVLRTARQAAVLVEAGVIAHPEEEKRLADPATQDRIASALASGIQTCLGPAALQTARNAPDQR
jgi:N-acetylmuramoyl-L-alanine amidase